MNFDGRPRTAETARSRELGGSEYFAGEGRGVGRRGPICMEVDGRVRRGRGE